MKSKLLILLLMLLSIIELYSMTVNKNLMEPLYIDSLDKTYSLNRDWYIVPADEISDKSEWHVANISGVLQQSVPELKDYYGKVIYRLPLEISDFSSSDEVALYLPSCYGSIQIKLNNRVIFKSVTEFGSKPILINVPTTYIAEGLNYLDLELGSYSSWTGSSGFLEIGAYEKVHEKWIAFLIKNIAIGFICIFLTIYFIIHYIYRKKEKYNLLFSALCFSVGLFILGYYGLWYYLFNYSWAYWLLTFIGGIGMYLLPILFIYSFYGLKLGKAGKVFTVFYILLILFVVIEYFTTKQLFIFNKYIYILFNLSYIALVVYLFIVSISAVKNDRKYSKMMLLGILLLSVSFIYSMLVFALIISKEPIIGEGFFAMVIVFSIVLAKRFARTHTDLELSHALNLELNRTLEEKVKHRTKELKRKNDEIMESIGYAALIQNSILPSNDILGKYLKDFYVLWKPKGVVGGDFYWFYKKDKNFLLAVVDCTGHGVPGALLTMTATSVLERIVAHINHSDPAVILKELNRILKRILRQEDSDYITDDGLDIGLCHYDDDEKTITYSGSKIRLHVVDNGGLTEIKGDRQGIGYDRSDEDYEYTNHKIPVTKDKTFYMTTDGYLDQSGGEYEYGFGWTKYKRLLIENHKDNMTTQIEKLEQALNQYQSECEQRDDITLLGFRVDTDE